MKIYLIDELKIAFTVTDTFLSLGLFTLDGRYDVTMDLVSEDKKALKWGLDLFEYFRKKSRRVI